MSRNNFPDVEVDWEPDEYVGYWLRNRTHLWVTVRTNWTLLWLRWAVQEAFQLPPDLAGQLGVRDEDVKIGRQGNPIGMKKVRVRINETFNPESEALLRLLKEAHDSALNVW